MCNFVLSFIGSCVDFIWRSLLKSFKLDDGKRGKYKMKAESVKTGQSVKIEFFEALLQLKSKNLKLKKDRQKHRACCKTLSEKDKILVILGISSNRRTKYVSGQQNNKVAS